MTTSENKVNESTVGGFGTPLGTLFGKPGVQPTPQHSGLQEPQSGASQSGASQSGASQSDASQSDASQPGASMYGSTSLLEVSLASVVVPMLHTWLNDVADAIPRVVGQKDGEAVHDLRVSLRRIRSLLRVVRPVFGKFWVARIRGDMSRAAAATGALRDEEVLAETLGDLGLPESHRRCLEPWLQVRRDRENKLRDGVIQLLSEGALDAPRAELWALITLPVRPGRDKWAHRFARRVVWSAQRQVDVLRAVNIADVQGMHNLRIAYKRLRYTVEAFGAALPPELRAWGQVAAAFQKVLGQLHDYDVALDIIRGAADVPESTRLAVVDMLTEKRREQAQRYVDAVGFEVRRAEVPSATASNLGFPETYPQTR